MFPPGSGSGGKRAVPSLQSAHPLPVALQAEPHPRMGHLPPFYKFVFHTAHPTLSFLGLPAPTPAPFLLFELQARWVANVWAGKVCPPAPGGTNRRRGVFCLFSLPALFAQTLLARAIVSWAAQQPELV